MISQQTPKAASLPAELESAKAKLVYLYLSTAGDATLADLQQDLGVKRLSLYGILGTLRERGLVKRDGDSYCCATARSGRSRP